MNTGQITRESIKVLVAFGRHCAWHHLFKEIQEDGGASHAAVHEVA